MHLNVQIFLVQERYEEIVFGNAALVDRGGYGDADCVVGARAGALGDSAVDRRGLPFIEGLADRAEIEAIFIELLRARDAAQSASETTASSSIEFPNQRGAQ